MLDILVVEDDKIQRENLVEMIKDIEKGINIYEACTEKKALEIANTHNIDFFYIDIALKDSSGLILAKRLRKIQKYKLSWIIFITTHVQYMLQAFKEVHCYDYLLKPYDKEQVKKITKVLIENRNNECASTCEARKYVIFDLKDISIKIFVDEIIFIEVSLRTCTIHTKKGKYKIKKMPLKKVLQLINEKNIIQSHKSFAINLNYIKAVEKYSATSWTIYFEDYNETALMGSKFKEQIHSKFN